MSRRGLLQLLGGAALAAPMLLSNRGARRAAAAGGVRPRRLVVFYTPHGAPAELFWPKSATDLTSSGDVSILAPLQRHAARLNVLRGIDYVGSDNHYANRDVLTAKGPDSVDTLVGRATGTRVLRLGVVPDYAQSFTVDGYLTLDGGRPVQANPDPVAALAGLGLPAGGTTSQPTPMPTGPTSADLRGEAMRAADGELAELRARVQSPALEGRLDKHRAAIAAFFGTRPPGTGTGLPPMVAGCTTQPSLPAVDKVRGQNVWAHERFADVMAAQNEVASFALRCGLARAVTIQAGYVNHGVPFTWLGIGGGHHGLSHGARREHALCQQWLAGQFASLLDSLNVVDPEDPEHTVLDNTTALWTSEIADGNLHNCQSLPIVLAGGGSGTLRTGQYLQLGGVSHARLLASIATAAGAPGQTFGGPGVLTEVMA